MHEYRDRVIPTRIKSIIKSYINSRIATGSGRIGGCDICFHIGIHACTFPVDCNKCIFKRSAFNRYTEDIYEKWIQNINFGDKYYGDPK